MTNSAPDRGDPASDVAETIAFLKASPDYIEGLSEGNLRAKLKTLPRTVRRLIVSLVGVEWSDAIGLIQKLGVGDLQDLDLIRPLVERFKPLAPLFDQIKARAEFQKEYPGIEGIRPQHLFEMSIGVPILRLQFLDKDAKVLFEFREPTPDMTNNALGIMVAVAQSFELCRERKLTLQSSLIQHVKDGLTNLLREVRRVAVALNIPEDELFENLSGAHSSQRPDVEEENLKGQ